LSRVGPYVIAGANLAKPRTDLKRPWNAGGGLGLPIIGRLLGHTQPSTTARYSHLADDPLRRASEAVSIRIAAAMGESPRADTGDYPPISVRRDLGATPKG
jgi:hypothetical protein